MSQPCPHLTLARGEQQLGFGVVRWWYACSACEVSSESRVSRAHALAILRAGKVVEPEKEEA